MSQPAGNGVMQVIRVRPDGSAVCSKCGGSDFTIRPTRKGAWLAGFVFAPRRAICNHCGTPHQLRERGPYSG